MGWASLIISESLYNLIKEEPGLESFNKPLCDRSLYKFEDWSDEHLRRRYYKTRRSYKKMRRGSTAHFMCMCDAESYKKEMGLRGLIRSSDRVVRVYYTTEKECELRHGYIRMYVRRTI